MDKLDILDQKILYELDMDARISATQLARKLKRSKETVNFRINRLIAQEYIKGFYTVFNTSKLGLCYYKVYLKFASITTDEEEKLITYIKAQPFVAYLASLEGSYDCIFLIMVRDASMMDVFMQSFMKLFGNAIKEKEITTFLSTHRLNERFFYGTERHDWSYPVVFEPYTVDVIDKQILAVLSIDARIPVITLARRIGVDAQTVLYHIKRLMQDNIILAYVTSLNFEKLGLEFIQLNISLKNPALRKSLIEYFSSTNKCLFAIEMLGRYDLTIELHVKDRNELQKILFAFRNKFVNQYTECVVSTITKEHVVVWSPFSSEMKMPSKNKRK